jgi:hypothetical protein
MFSLKPFALLNKLKILTKAPGKNRKRRLTADFMIFDFFSFHPPIRFFMSSNQTSPLRSFCFSVVESDQKEKEEKKN